MTCINPISFGATEANPSTHSKTPWYQVEMIIFSQLDLGQQQDETWPQIPAFSLPTTPTISLVPPAIYQDQLATSLPGYATSYPLVASTDFQLQAEAAHLLRGEHYQIIGQLAWLEPIANNKTPIHIQAANDQTSMDALVTITKKHFFQMHINAVFSTALSAFSNPNDNLKAIANEDGQVRFQLIQSMRMRSGELDYIDFPFYGILVEIFPHNAPAGFQEA